MSVVVAVDAGTTGVRALAVDQTGRPVHQRYVELPQHFPRPGWVEHDPGEILAAVRSTIGSLTHDLDEPVAAVGLTNQRETAVAWDRRDGRPLARAIVWQDRRTAGHCRRLSEAGFDDLVRARTGLVLDPYFSATKWAWLLELDDIRTSPHLVLSTLDTYLAWHLTGGGTPVTEPSNASRTLCYDILERGWSDELCDLFGIPVRSLPELRPSASRLGVCRSEEAPGLGGVPLSGMAGDQQAALFGQGCIGSGQAKCTYGTGSFVLATVGREPPEPHPGTLTTVAWDLAGHGGFAYALEGAVFSTGATIQWLRDGLGLIGAASELEPLARTVADSGGVAIVPAFAGLGSPWWDPFARGAVVGITKGSTRAHIARAVVDSIAFQVRDVTDAMAEAMASPLRLLRVDGGASVMDLLCQVQADQLGFSVARSSVPETTGLGAAYLAGMAEGIWSGTDEIAALWSGDAEFEPRITRGGADARQATWRRAVQRALDWAREDPANGGEA